MTWTDRLGEFGIWRRSTEIDETLAVEIERLAGVERAVLE